jgi:hypothetical protein
MSDVIATRWSRKPVMLFSTQSDDFAEPYPVLPTVQHLTLKSMIALIGYTNNPNHSYRFVLESG